MIFERKNLNNNQLIEFYKKLLWPRLIEEKMLILLRQGRIGKWFSGIGQEAIAVGSTLAMQPHEYILPMHRNLGVFTTRDIPLSRLMAQWQGKASGFTKGRDRSFHFGTQQYKIIGMISHLGPQMALADGIALADVLSKKRRATLVYTGEGGTSEGDFHEALNIASVWNLPVIFLIENNGYGLSTPVSEQYRCKSLVDRAAGYGMEGVQIDGNNILTVLDTVKGVREYCITNQKPYLIECMTFRMRGHEEASGTKYVPKELFDEWRKKDPVENFENYLVAEQVLEIDSVKRIRDEVRLHIEEELNLGFEAQPLRPDSNKELGDVYAPRRATMRGLRASKPRAEVRFVDAISEGLRESMREHENLVLMGQDIAEYGGAFKVTEGFLAEFGKGRVRNTPLCESGILGTALGLSLEQIKSVVEMQFADFVTSGFNQVVNNLAKIHYRWEQPADVVVRMPTGAGVGAGPFHSQSNEAWFVHTPGLKVVYPSTPEDAKGLLIASINDPNPVMYFEHKLLYRSINGQVPEGYYETEIGKARLVREGSDLSI